MMIILMQGGVMFDAVACCRTTISSSVLLETFFNSFLVYATIYKNENDMKEKINFGVLIYDDNIFIFAQLSN